MRINKLAPSCFLLLILHSFHVEASFYSLQNNDRYSSNALISQFNLVVLTSKDCEACKKLQSELQLCTLPDNFKIAWVGSQVSRYKFQSANFNRIKTSEKIIQKIASLTPKSILNGRAFKEGVFNCQELERAIK